MNRLLLCVAVLLTFLACDKDKNFLAGYLTNTRDAIYINCDPYKEQKNHTCTVFATDNGLRIYNNTDDEFVLGPTGYFPLKINTGNFNHLSEVISANKKANFFVAADEISKSLFIISTTDFKRPDKSINLPHTPSSVTAFSSDNSVINVAVSYNSKNFIDLFSINISNNNSSKKTIVFESVPTTIKIDEKAFYLVASHEQNDFISVLSLASEKIQKINIGFASNRISIGYQDNQLYALAFKDYANKIALVNIDNKSLVATKNVENLLLAAYLPSGVFNKCQNHEKWFLIADNKSNINYFSFNADINHITSLALKDKEVLDISNLNIYKIIGTNIENVKSNICSRQIIFASSLAFDRYNQAIEIMPTSCEGNTKDIINMMSTETLLKNK